MAEEKLVSNLDPEGPPHKIIESRSFDGKHVLTFNDTIHRYRLNDRPVIGTTTFVHDGWPTSEGLVQWGYGEAAKSAVSQLITMFNGTGWTPGTGDKPLFSLDEENLKLVVKIAKAAPRLKMQEAGDIGSYVHAFAEAVDSGDAAAIAKVNETIAAHPEKERIGNATGAFMRWWEQNHDTEVKREQIVAYVCPACDGQAVEQFGACYCFGGKFDRLSYRPGIGWVLSDYKTGKRIYVEQFIQFASYRKAIKRWWNLEVNALEVLRFGKDGASEPMMIRDMAEIAKLERMAMRCRETVEDRRFWERDDRFNWRDDVRKKAAKDVSKRTEAAS